jgi:glycosyltransferase involved in cell wall biosynthesis
MIQQDPRFFCYKDEYFGGTEYMARYFHQNIAPYVPRLKEYNCLILPGQTDKPYFELIYEPKQIIIWLHNLVDQFGFQLYHMFTDKRFLDKVKYIITVSKYHKQDVIKKTGIDPNKVIVIYNAISEIENDINRFDNVKIPELIYTSSPGRGLEIGLHALSKLEIDFRLNIFNEIIPDTVKIDHTNKKILQDPRFFFYGKTPHKTVLDHMSRSHIFMHTSNWHETFCLSLVESLAANCLSVYSNFGSLKEIGSNYGIMYDIEGKTNEEHVEIFTQKIITAIEMIKQKQFNPKDQAKIISNKFSWDVFTNNWIKFYEEKI